MSSVFTTDNLFIMNGFIFTTLLIMIISMFYMLANVKKESKNIFNEIYIVNLERRPDRLNRFLEYYNKSDLQNYSVNKFNAVDGSKIDVDTVPLTELARLEMKQLETMGFRYKHYQLTKGAIGCYLSHVKIWEHIVDHDYEMVLVFEDDARPPPNFLKLVKQNLKLIPKDWDIVLLGKLCNSCVDKGGYYDVNRFMLTHAYLIKKKAIIKILETDTLFPISQQIDAYMSELSSTLKIYAVKKDIVRQGQSRTDIQAPIIKSSLNNIRAELSTK